MTPIIDTLLQLFMFLLLGVSFAAILKLNLPEAKSAKMAEKNYKPQVDIGITREGPVYLDGKLVTRQELKEQIKIMHNNNPDLRVIVRSDRFARFQEVVNVLDLLNELGITKLNIATRTETE